MSWNSYLNVKDSEITRNSILEANDRHQLSNKRYIANKEYCQSFLLIESYQNNDAASQQLAVLVLL